ncbi:MAG: type IV pilus biogenesis protein PilM, partial [Chloroflexota bacterium]
MKTPFGWPNRLVSPRKLSAASNVAEDEAVLADLDVAPVETPTGPSPTSRRFRLPGWPSFNRARVTASVEGTSLRVVSVIDRRVAGWASIPLDSRLVKNGQISDPTDLGAVIGETFDRLELSRRNVAWALPGFQASARILDVPILPGAELRRAITDEVEASLGAAADDSYLSWQRLDGRIRRRGVFVLAVPRSTVLTALEALEVAEIRPSTMDLRPLALARAIGRNDAVVANLEDGNLDVAVVSKGVPTVLRSIPLPGQSASLEPAQNRLVDEIDRALRYHDDANLDRPLDPETPVYLTGRLATGIALTEKIRALTGHPIGRLATGISYPVDFPVSEYLVN